MRYQCRSRTARVDGEYERPGDGECQIIADGNHFSAEGPLVYQERWAVQDADLVNFNFAVWKLEWHACSAFAWGGFDVHLHEGKLKRMSANGAPVNSPDRSTG